MTNARRGERETVQIVSVSPRRMWGASAKIIFYVKRTILIGSWDPGQSRAESSSYIMVMAYSGDSKPRFLAAEINDLL